MQLKQIKLAGFKSFVDPTKIPFDQPLTAIIGPNGCGKSNVIDAVRWVLGESSAKHLRGDSMTDVIFNGSAARKPISVASVELTFDNSQGRLTGQYASYQEISVKRQVNRDSESSYFLNSQKCRRKDITDLFMGTGLGPRSYAIIEQGTISRLIESKPQDLRVFIEEAAGISRYKERRRETENRIKHTRENLERLNDIRQELAVQIDRLAQQAQEAKQYRQLKSQERALHSQLLVGRYKELLVQHDLVQSQLSQLFQQEEQLTAQQQTSETLIIELQQQSHLLVDEEQKWVEQYYQAGNQVTKLEQQLKHQQQQDSRRQQNLEQLKQAIEQASARYEQVSNELTQLLTQQSELQQQSEAIAINLEMVTEQVDEVEQLTDALVQQKNQQNSTYNDAKTQLAVYQSRLQHQQDLLEKHQHSIPVLQHKLEQISLQDLTNELNKLELSLITLADNVSQQQQLKAQHQAEIKQKQQHLEQAQAQYQKITHELSTSSARLALIDEWLVAQQGDDALPKVWQVIEVVPGYEKAIDVVLQNISHLNVFDYQANDANQINKGFERNQAFQNEALNSPVNLAPWFENVSFVDDLPQAKTLLATMPNSMLVATKDGYLVGQGFTLSISHQQSAISLHAEKGQLMLRVEELTLQASECLQHKTDALTELADMNQQLNVCQQQLQQWLLQQTSAQAKIESVTLQHQQQLASSAQLSQELQQAELQLQQDKVNTEALSMQVEDIDVKAKVAQQHYQKTTISLEQSQSKLRELKANKQQLEKQLNQLNQGLQHINTQIAVSQQQAEQQREKVADLNERYQNEQLQSQSNGDLPQVELEKLNGQLAEHLDLQQSIQLKLTANRQQQAELQQRIDSSVSMQKQQLVTMQGLTNKISTLKLRREGLNGQSETQKQLIDEADIQLDTVLASLDEKFDVKKCSRELDNIRQQIVELGAINLAAIEEYDAQRERKDYLDSQDSDLNQGLSTLEDAIRKIDKETRTRFKNTFDAVNKDLMALFPKVFGGGKAYLALTDDNLLETGVSIMAQPPGKKNSTIHLLSGGEKALTALSLVFAIFRLNPAPFCMLDEVDAPLDDANVERFCRLLQEMSQSVQFVYISHNKITMEMADQLIGVTMHEPGVSRIVAVDIEAAVALADAV
ncbi:chromosome segregation protein SMC [Shewanella gaetbuli]|uniref:Chromosome partition protein Smc n=1 Tax=Shewanella gaetbuli TaxID=220752 RepID=A0A9X1ZNZ5_9GAMM|nr:chromosome segregation protein SMC [Shewanella gaetbuli]MCL1143415.1 chromosome segregation protein SMC [Shewanella gaetbuli]